MADHDKFKQLIDVAYAKNIKEGDTCIISIRETDVAISVEDSNWSKEIYLVIRNPQTGSEKKVMLVDHTGNVRVTDSLQFDELMRERKRLETALRSLLGLGEGYNVERLLDAAKYATQEPLCENSVHVLEPITWVIDNILAYGPRPGRYRAKEKEQVKRFLVDDWIAARRAEGIRSIICLLDDEHLRLYRALPNGLVAYYRLQELQVAHVPTPDYQALSLKAGEKIWTAFQHSEKPVLVHCSSGKGRSREAAQYIAGRHIACCPNQPSGQANGANSLLPDESPGNR